MASWNNQIPDPEDYYSLVHKVNIILKTKGNAILSCHKLF